MNETKFKVGDRVRYTPHLSCTDIYVEACIENGDELEVAEVIDKGGYEEVYVKVETTNWIDENEIELVSRPSDDPKTAFLTELKALLEKYDAQIRDYEEYCVEIRIGNEWLSWYSKEKISGQGEGITPSNIFDYDK